jgi:uncharacterized protein
MNQKPRSARKDEDSTDHKKHAAMPNKTAQRGKVGDEDENDERPAEDEGDSGKAARGRGGNFADDPKRASEAGRKGGQQSHSR